MVSFKTPTNEGYSPRQYCCFDAFQGRVSHESLIQGDAKTGLPTVPMLASEWKLDEAQNTVTFKLRQGVQFHNNYGEMTAKDWVYTLDSLKQNEPASTNTWVLTWWRPFVKNVEAVNDYEIKFSIEPQAQFWYFISDVFGQLPVRSKAQFEKEGGEPKSLEAGASVGTGPYQWKERKTGSYVRFDRVPYKHWRVTPDFPEFEFRWINEPSTRLAGLLAGEIHITDVPSDLQQNAEKQGMKRIQNQALSPRVMASLYCCYYQQDNKTWPMYPDSALLNVKVREALNHAVDRESLGRAFAPKRTNLYLSHYNPQRPAWNPDWEKNFPEKYGYNPDKAKQLLSEAGYGPSNPLEIDMTSENLTYIANGPDINDAMAGYFRAVGVKVNLLNLDPTTLQTQIRAYRFKNLVRMNSIGSNLLDGLIIWNLAGNPGPAAGFYNPELTAMKDELNRQMDTEKQVPILRKIGDWGYNNYWDIPLWYVPLEVMANPKVVDNWTYPGSANGGWSHFETITAAK